MAELLSRLLFAGFVRLHVLHHAAEEAVCGVYLVEWVDVGDYRIDSSAPGQLDQSIERPAAVHRGADQLAVP